MLCRAPFPSPGLQCQEGPRLKVRDTDHLDDTGVPLENMTCVWEVEEAHDDRQKVQPRQGEEVGSVVWVSACGWENLEDDFV